MQTKSIFAGIGCLFFLMFVLSSCISAKTSKKEQAPDENSIVQLDCSYSWYDGNKNQTLSDIKKFQFDSDKSTIAELGPDPQQVKEIITPDFIKFETVKEITTDYEYAGPQKHTFSNNYEINRKTLGYRNWGEHRLNGVKEGGWKYHGSCKKVIASTEGNKI
jgi:hypothetical protein